MIVSNGFKNKEERLRQHSMLVVPVLISIKPSVFDSSPECMREVMEEIAFLLYDEVAVVKRTAKRLLLELKKAYE